MGEVGKRLRRGEDGQGLVEYALMVLMISVVVIATLRIISSTMHLMYSNAHTHVVGPSASSSTPCTARGESSHDPGPGNKSAPGTRFSPGGGTGSQTGKGPERDHGARGGKGAGNGHGAK
jgi:Flp pilus assembly pilin Flp